MTQPSPERDVVTVSKLTVPFFIGVNDFEKFRPQNVEITVRMHVPAAIRESGRYVSYTDVVDYVLARSQAGEHVRLVEILAGEIAEKALENPDVERVDVLVLKCDIYPQAAGVGVEISKSRSRA